MCYIQLLGGTAWTYNRSIYPDCDVDATNIFSKFLNANSIDVASHDDKPKVIHSNDSILTPVGSNACPVVDFLIVDALSSIKRTIKIEKD
ncbi:hypothetical protein RJT34_17951 [Clitoria ternatea]|uniref:Uncharacterized protein n=1 Tax=Clitoria ternatea TaxID=43366 RepID=A0AAN9JC35_CLITE